MKTVLITGATGDVGTHLSRELAGKYKLRLSDKRLLKAPKGQTFVRADITKMADAIRIGNVNPKPIDKRRLSLWFSPRDLAQLVAIGIEHPDIKFEIVYGISGNKRAWYDNSNAYRLGYRPQDDSEIYAAEVLAREKP